MTPRDPRRWLDTTPLEADLERRALRGGRWVALSRGIGLTVEVCGTLVLVRLLAPEQFGVVGMVAAMTGLLTVFRDMGLSLATIQRPEISHQQVSQLLWINVAVGAALGVIALALALPLAWFYGTPAAAPVTMALSATFVLGGFAIQHQALLRRSMCFGRLAAVDLVATTSSVALAIAMALGGFGYWALVGKWLASQAVTTAASWLACDFRPARPRRGVAVAPLLRFGRDLTAFGLINYVARNLDDVLVGRVAGAHVLGLYQKAYQVPMMPLVQLNTPISGIAIPALSRLAEQPERYRRTYLRILRAILLVTMPLGGLLLTTADWVVVVVFGTAWREAGPLLGWLSLTVFVQPLGNSTGWLFVSQARTRDMLRWGAIGALLSVGAFVAGLPWGALGIAAAYAGSGLVLRTPLLLYFVGRQGPVATRDFYRAAAPFALSGLASAAAIQAMRHQVAPATPEVGLLLAGATTALVSVLVLSSTRGGRSSFRDVASLFVELRDPRRSDRISVDPPSP